MSDRVTRRDTADFGLLDHAREWLTERPQDITDALTMAADCVDFAYEHGYHEHGVPVPDALLILAREYDITPRKKPALATSETQNAPTSNSEGSS